MIRWKPASFMTCKISCVCSVVACWWSLPAPLYHDDSNANFLRRWISAFVLLIAIEALQQSDVPVGMLLWPDSAPCFVCPQYISVISHVLNSTIFQLWRLRGLMLPVSDVVSAAGLYFLLFHPSSKDLNCAWGTSAGCVNTGARAYLCRCAWRHAGLRSRVLWQIWPHALQYWLFGLAVGFSSSTFLK